MVPSLPPISPEPRMPIRMVLSQGDLLRQIHRGLVLLVADLLHPVHDLAVELFLNGDMGHGRGRRCAMPMLLARRARDHVTRTNHPDRTAPALDQPAARRDDQSLTQRVGVPCAARAW